MDDNFSIRNEDLRDALIIAGMNELEHHGLSGFSLRRVASSCGVSCAAPYRHFKSKDDLILAIIEYIYRRWSMLCEHIRSTFSADIRKCLTEICIAHIRFWIANPNFRSIMTLDDKSLDTLQLRERSKLNEDIHDLIGEFCLQKSVNKDAESKMNFAIHSILFGAMQMLGSGEITNTPETMDMIRSCIDDVITSALT